MPKDDVFFYLDAHQPGNVPLSDELDLIFRNWQQPVVMIDDFEVPGDPGYGFNEYGPGQRFGTELFSATSRTYSYFYPATSSGEETGYRRGCILLALPGRWVERLRSLSLVRERART